MEERGKRKSKKIIISCVCVTLAFILAAGAFVGYKFYTHEKNQNARMASLEGRVSKLSAELVAASTKDIKWLDEGFNYLGIGNSLTLHGITSFWWNEVGMAASDAEHDYFHIVSASLKNTHPNFMSVPYNFSVWETQSHDRDETLEYLDHYLSPKLNLITIQLAENASDLTTYQEDYVSLINYVKSKAPNARILVIGDFWSHNNRNDLKIKAVNETGVEYVSLEGIADNADYYCGLGTIVYDNEGNEHKVEHSSVAHHPSDKGMKAIADRIIEAIK